MASLRTLAIWLQGPARALYEYGHSLDKRLVVTSARRSHSEQSRLYNRCRHGGCDLPVAPPGYSMHEKGRAFDMARPGVDPHVDELLAVLGRVWLAAGGTWGGIDGTDPVHFEA